MSPTTDGGMMQTTPVTKEQADLIYWEYLDAMG